MSRVFISYSRTDEVFARRLATDLDALSVDIWIDVDDIPTGMNWSDAIDQGLKSCDLLLLIITPESMASRNVSQEWQFFLDQGRPVLPVMLRPAELHFQLNRLQYVDFHVQQYPAAFRALSRELISKGIHLQPRQSDPKRATQPRPAVKAPAQLQGTDVLDLIAEYYRAFGDGDLDAAERYLAEIKRARDLPPVFDVDQAAQNIRRKRQARTTGDAAQRAYEVLKIRAQYDSPDMFRDAVLDFIAAFPLATRYDPDGIFPVLAQDVLPPPFEWVKIPAGQVMIEEHGQFDVAAFKIAKYPITNKQFQVFVEAKDGYGHAAWWNFSRQAYTWYEENPHSQATAFEGANLSRTNVNWFEAVAFCRWLSAQTGEDITLPTEQQWQRAAQGDDGREYPWGNEEPHNMLCNFNKNVGQTTPVTRYPDGASPYGVLDMAGNVWEWCLNPYDDPRSVDLAGDAWRVLRGGSWYDFQDFTRAAYRGSWLVSHGDARAAYRSPDDPLNWYGNIGFRVLRPPSR